MTFSDFAESVNSNEEYDAAPIEEPTNTEEN
jgi:hypothetical protein